MLGKVITKLASNSSAAGNKGSNAPGYVNYRESKLTHLLKDSLGGNSKTVIICTLNPNYLAMKDTLSTLKFAERAKKIKNKAKINEENNDGFFKKLYNGLFNQVQLLK